MLPCPGLPPPQVLSAQPSVKSALAIVLRTHADLAQHMPEATARPRTPILPTFSVLARACLVWLERAHVWC